MKKNNKGFTIVETLITSTLIISTLVFLYVQFNNLKRSYDDSFHFNTVEGIHKAKQLAGFYKNNPTLQCNSSTAPCINARNEMYSLLDIKGTILMSDLQSSPVDYTKLSSVCNQSCERFMNKIKTDTSNTRLVVIYSDKTYASVLVK